MSGEAIVKLKMENERRGRRKQWRELREGRRHTVRDRGKKKRIRPKVVHGTKAKEENSKELISAV